MIVVVLLGRSWVRARERKYLSGAFQETKEVMQIRIPFDRDKTREGC